LHQWRNGIKTAAPFEIDLALGRAASHLFNFRLLAAARIIPRLLGGLLLARRALCLFAFFFAQCFGICHVPVLVKN
ncbi:MAG TPA: hypothetical protein VFR24_08270, partial [Candidatus Angelobacter sp.]|nr:hypothetical protein [Candidatus Angelobacter sp.]